MSGKNKAGTRSERIKERDRRIKELEKERHIAEEREAAQFEEAFDTLDNALDAVGKELDYWKGKGTPEFRLKAKEARWNMYMRGIVVFTFSLVGPILLLVYLVGITVPETVLDIFKIWLGAAIGISTNLLQRQERVPIQIISPKPKTTPKRETS